jgi:RNA polymerase sigma-70 factor (ECF subfamily)
MTTADYPEGMLGAAARPGAVGALGDRPRPAGYLGDTPRPPGFQGEDDAALVARIRAGDKAAEEMVYRRHVRYVGGMLVRLLGSRADAEDAIQETFVIALEQVGSLRDPRALRGWLAQIAVSQARRKFRRRKLLRALGLDGTRHEVDLEAFARAEVTADVRARISTLAKLLGRLPVDQRVAWSLRNIEGQALEEVALLCGCSLATAKRRIAQADEWIRDRYGREEGAP